MHSRLGGQVKKLKLGLFLLAGIIAVLVVLVVVLKRPIDQKINEVSGKVFGKAEGFTEEMDGGSASAMRMMVSAKRSQSFAPTTIMPMPTIEENRDNYDHKEINPVKSVATDPVSTFSIDVDTASYANLRRYLNEGNLPPKDAIRVEELINYFDYTYKGPSNKSTPFSIYTSLTQTPWNKDTKLLHIAIKGYEIDKSKRPKANIVFLLDTSGSMESPDKLPLLKRSVELMVNQLDKNDRVSIVTYAGSSIIALPPTPGNEQGKILDALSALNAGGGTAGADGIKTAYDLAKRHFDKKSVNRIILATDGDFNIGISNSDELKGYIERKRKDGIYLSILGFGRGNYNDSTMQALAQAGNGNASYIDGILEAKKVLVDEMTSTVFPIANDVKIQVEFNPAVVSEYRLIGYETRMLNREDFKNDKVDAGDIGAGHKVTAIYEITPKGSKAELLEPLRYQKEKKEAVKSDEYGFVKIRYKEPGKNTSKLIERTIVDDDFKELKALDDNRKFSIAVAAFGQILKGGTYTKDYSIDDVMNLARSARGDDLNGYRAEFIKLLELSKMAKDM